MINTDIIHQDFCKLIFQEPASPKLGLSRDALIQVRHKLNAGKNIRLDYKLKLLQRAGHRYTVAEFTHEQAIALIKFTLRTSAIAKEFGAEYILEKWKKQCRP